jgi:hypothetical protein
MAVSKSPGIQIAIKHNKSYLSLVYVADGRIQFFVAGLQAGIRL